MSATYHRNRWFFFFSFFQKETRGVSEKEEISKINALLGEHKVVKKKSKSAIRGESER